MNKFNIENLNLFYGENQALKKICLPIPNRQVTALIGPSGCGKSTPASLLKPHERPYRRR